jgi:hypothetical protein
MDVSSTRAIRFDGGLRPHHVDPPAQPTGGDGEKIPRERRAWFDLNGDGRISDQPVLWGGDGYLPAVPGGPVSLVSPAERERQPDAAHVDEYL